MLLVAPSADGPPGVVVHVFEVEQDEETFVAADFPGLHRIGEAVGLERSLQGIGAACAGIGGIGHHAILHAPLSGAGLVLPVGRRRGGTIDEDVTLLVGHLDVVELCRGGPCCHTDGMQFAAVVLLGPLHVLLADVLSVHALGIIGGCAHGLLSIVVDHGGPARVVHMGNGLAETEHLHHVGVVFGSAHEDGFAQSGLHVAEFAFLLRGSPLAYVDLRFGARIAVEVVVGTDEPLGRAVVVFVDQVDRMGKSPLREVGSPAGVVADTDDFGIFLLDGIVELDIALGIVVERVVLVANLDIFQVEGLGMSGCGTLGTPCGVDVAVAVFNQVERLLDVLVEVEVVVRPVVSHTDVDHIHGYGTDVLAVLQIFVDALSVGHHVAPAVVPQLYALFLRTHRVFPQIAAVALQVCVPRAFNVASAREAHEGGLDVGEHLSHVATESVFAVVERRGEEAHHVEHHLGGTVEAQVEISGRCRAGGGDGGGVLPPFWHGID